MRGEQKLWSLVRLLGSGLLIALMAFVFRNESLQSANWSFPYFSGAANFERPFDWRISPSEFEKVSQMSVEEHRSYRYVATSETIPNTINSYGYVLVALAARSMFFWVGDIQSVIMLQVLVHIGISLLFMAYLLESRLQRGLFFVVYAVNPLVLHIATFPFFS